MTTDRLVWFGNYQYQLTSNRGGRSRLGANLPMPNWKPFVLLPLSQKVSYFFIWGCFKIFVGLKKSKHVLISFFNIIVPSNYIHVIIQIQNLNLRDKFEKEI